MRITNVTIEGMHHVLRKSYDLTNNLTYLHGPNGAGKSTVLQAIQLALLGYIPGTSKASKEAIFKHSNGHALAVTLQIENDAGEPISVSRVWSGTKSNISSTATITPDGYDIHSIIEELELPIFNFSEFLGLTANKMKDWFIDFLPSQDMSIDWKQVLTDSATEAGYHVTDADELVDKSTNYINNLGTTGSDLVRDANTYFKDCLSFAKDELKRANSTIQSLIFYDDLDNSIDPGEIKANIKKYETLKADRASYAAMAKRNKSIEVQLASYSDCTAESFDKDARYTYAAAQIDDCNEAIRVAQESIIKLQNQSADIAAEIAIINSNGADISATIRTEQVIATSDGICPFTKSKCDSVQPLIESYKQDIIDLSQQLEEIRETLTAKKAEKDEIEKQINELHNQVDTNHRFVAAHTSTLGDIKNRYAMIQNLKSQISIIPEFDDTVDYDSIIADLQEQLAKLTANAQYNQLIDKLTANKYQIEQEIIAFNAWIKLTGVNGLQNDDSAIKPFLDLQDDMNTYLQIVFGGDVTSKFNLEAKANSFSFGIERDGVYIPYTLLSSGEKCMYTLALMMSLVKVSKSPLKLIMVDDLLDHLDDVNIDKLFNALVNVKDIQMIFAGVKPVSTSNITVEVTR